MNVAENICPVCKTKNEPGAIVCRQCGSALGELSIESGMKTKTTDMQAVTPEMIREWSVEAAAVPEAPERGIAVYVEREAGPAYVDSTGEFLLGRRTGTTEGMLVDLSPFGAYSLGVSRQHVVIRRSGDGYELMDLGSVNGTWLREERLVPHTSYPLPSGSFLRLGRMRLLVLYRPVAKTE